MLYLQNGIYREGRSLVTVTASDGYGNTSGTFNSTFVFEISYSDPNLIVSWTNFNPNSTAQKVTSLFTNLTLNCSSGPENLRAGATVLLDAGLKGKKPKTPVTAMDLLLLMGRNFGASYLPVAALLAARGCWLKVERAMVGERARERDQTNARGRKARLCCK